MQESWLHEQETKGRERFEERRPTEQGSDSSFQTHRSWNRGSSKPAPSMATESKENLRNPANQGLFTEHSLSASTIWNMRILIVEDKRSLAGHLGRALEGEGHKVTLAFDGEVALKEGRTNNFDLMLLDVMLPRMDGFSVIRKLRADRFAVQTILVSARDSMEDIVRGLDAGADDYLTKPFALDVLLAKVRAAARRVPEPIPSDLSFSDLTLRPHRFEMQRGTRIEVLTRTECALLELLIRRAGSVVPHHALIEAGWTSDVPVGYDSLYVFIRALRAKITHNPESPLLHTVRGVGYSLRRELC
jgi:DNA-binding response OmpR family regulator